MKKQIIAGILIFAATFSGITFYNVQTSKAEYNDKIENCETNYNKLQDDFKQYIEFNDKLNLFITQYINTYVDTFGIQEGSHFPNDISSYKIEKLSDSDIEYLTKTNNIDEFKDISKKISEIISLVNDINTYYSEKKYEKDLKAGARNYHQKFIKAYKEFKELTNSYLEILNNKEISYLKDVSDIYIEGNNKEKAYEIKNYMIAKNMIYYIKNSLAEIG